MTLWRPACSVLFLVATVQAGGCAALPLATLGSLVGVGASAVSTGNDIYQLGKLDTAQMASFDQAVAAAQCAAEDLCLSAKQVEHRDRGVRRLTFADDRGAGIKVDVEPRTPRLVRVRIDVGWFGSQQTARLYLARMRAHLPPGSGGEAGAPTDTNRPAGSQREDGGCDPSAA
jgi:hypothetical protein